MKRPYQITAIVFCLFSVFVITESVRLKYYDYLGPGPGFFPFWIAAIQGLLSVRMFYHATWGKGRSELMAEDFFPSRDGYLRILTLILGTAGVVVLLEPLGFRLSMLAYLLFLLLALGRVNPIATALVALAGSFGTYHVFVDYLGVVLPKGMLGI